MEKVNQKLCVSLESLKFLSMNQLNRMNKLKSLIGGSNNVMVTGRINGYQLELVQSNASRRYYRG